MCTNGPVYAPFIGAAFVWILVLGYVGFWLAKGVTIVNGVYTMFAVVIIRIAVNLALNQMTQKEGSSPQQWQ